jgi:hypothetical protein
MEEAAMMDHIICSKSLKTFFLSSVFLAMFLTSPLSLAIPDFNADIDGDAFTNSLDISRLSSCFGQDPMSNSACASADVDEDGDIDVDDFSFVSDRLGQSYPWTIYPSPLANISPYGKQLGDINNDGILDMVALSGGQFTLWLGNGGSSFQEHHFSSEFRDGGFALEDVNADSKLDLVGIDSSGVNVAVRIGNGDGSFQAPRHYATGDVDNLMYLRDVNGDSKLDVLVETDCSTFVLFGNGDGSFQESQHVYNRCLNYWPLREFADLNGDGLIDALYIPTPYYYYLDIWTGQADGSISWQQRVEIGSIDTRDINLGDLNGDGALDVAVPYWGGVKILFNQGDGYFEDHYEINTDIADNVSLIDLNDDDSLDVLVTGYFADFVSVAINEGDGSFSNPQHLILNQAVYHMGAGDVDGDNIVDVLIHDGNNIVMVLGNGDDTFEISTKFYTGGNVDSSTLGDLNNDDILDIVSTNTHNGTIFVLIGDGNNGFQEHQAYPAGTSPTSISLGDVNDDGNPDAIVASSQNNVISVLLGNGDGSFQDQQQILIANAPGVVSLGDINGDAHLDGVFIESGNISVTLGNGDGTFQEQHHYPAGSTPVSVSLGDVNGDDRIDILVANRESDDVSVLLGNGNGGFQGQRNFDVGDSPRSARLGDVNADDHLDLVVANEISDDVSVLLGNGDGSFQTQQRFYSDIYTSSLSIGDINGDGVVDVAGARHNAIGISLFLGNGDGSFQEGQSFNSSVSCTYICNTTLLLGDVNGNGRLDSVITNDRSHSIDVFFNKGHLK